MTLNFDNVQLAIIGTAMALLVALLLRPIDATGVAKKASELEKDLFVPALQATAIIVGGFLAAIVVLDLLAAQLMSAAFASFILFALSVLLVAGALWVNLRPAAEEGEQAKAENDAGKTKLIGLSGFLSVASLTFILAPDFSEYLQWLVSPLRFLRELISTTTAVPAGSAAPFSTHASEALSVILAALSSSTVVIAASDKLAALLRLLLKATRLQEWQINAASRLRHRAQSAAQENLVARYSLEVRLDRMSIAHTSPFEKKGIQRARIKLIINEGGWDEGNDFTPERVRHILQSASVSGASSLFFVVSERKHKATEIVCYGTGEELLALSSPEAVGDEVVENFYRALNGSHREGIRDAVIEGRRKLVTRQPEQSVLLATTILRASDEIIYVLETMDKVGLDHVLLVSEFPPFERAIIGASEIGRYLRRRHEGPSPDAYFDEQSSKTY